ncbi:MAG: DUF1840 family protein [Caldimonas sp.]
MTMYRFKSKTDADLLMLAPAGDQILRIIGKVPASQGIIPASEMAEAIAALEVAIAAAEMARQAGAAKPDEEDAGATAIGLGQRAWPMLEMMRRSLAEHADIVWGV